ncbi:hypothetical protein B0H63DRAFT_542857 [Podospora didyma]|uniref:Uncharacterized protein n=1 Tax=Podospora didyma TaxID=330526 RepID=A0AAE0NNL3_9PEZI|nr:hypothetical protein B0H63DRAFT_542857 [Podospora didyma]
MNAEDEEEEEEEEEEESRPLVVHWTSVNSSKPPSNVIPRSKMNHMLKIPDLPILRGPENIQKWEGALRQTLSLCNLEHFILRDVQGPSLDSIQTRYGDWMGDRARVARFMNASLMDGAVHRALCAHGWNLDEGNSFVTFKIVKQAIPSTTGTPLSFREFKASLKSGKNSTPSPFRAQTPAGISSFNILIPQQHPNQMMTPETHLQSERDRALAEKNALEQEKMALEKENASLQIALKTAGTENTAEIKKRLLATEKDNIDLRAKNKDLLAANRALEARCQRQRAALQILITDDQPRGVEGTGLDANLWDVIGRE